ncbi:MAG TPA: NADP oxidoreductase [Candidatus Paceibacterota bacterium]|nr:NADP oxidoreductase [Verrucomicrobiota bacterium]HRY50739.1 NADP oxidoreductase [Candidatus Paceibacterota bacterium]
MLNKATIASDWLAGCAGCHMSLLDIDERLVTLLEHASLHATPITDLKHPPAQGVDVGLLEGCINNSSTERVAREMRARCRVLVALGDCAVFGGVPTLRNGVGCCAALNRAYVETESTFEGRVPKDPELAVMQDARALDQVVKVDVYLPGCPPPPEAILHVLLELAAGRKPALTGKNLDWH